MQTQGEDFVYNPDGQGGCSYEPLPLDRVDEIGADESHPKCRTGCLIGTALTIAGERRHVGFPQNVTSLGEEYEEMLSYEASSYFQAAQTSQDLGSTWGRAYATAEFAFYNFLRTAPLD